MYDQTHISMIMTLAELDAHRLDIAVLPIRPPAPRFVSRLLFEEDFFVAMRRDHPLAREPSVANYLAVRHMLVSAIGDGYGVVDAKARRGRTCTAGGAHGAQHDA